MNDNNIKQAVLHASFCAGIIGIAGLFIWFGMGYFIPSVLIVAAIVLALNILMRALGRLAAQKFSVKKWAGLACSIFLIVLTVIVSVSGIVYSAQDGMIFYSVKNPESREFLKGRPNCTEIEFTAGNGKTYHGMMYKRTDEKAPLIIYFGGNGEVSYQHFRLREEQNRWIYFSDCNFLFVDFEGYGLNSGKASYLNMYEESLAIFDYAASLSAVDSNRIISMGYSIGTGGAVYLAANRPVTGLILAAPYANGYDFYNNMLPIFKGPMKLLVKQKFPSDQYAVNVTCPVFVIASHSDETIPFSSTQRLVKLFAGKVDFIELDNTNHNSLFKETRANLLLQSFIEGVIK